jgi:hypothetical protein
VRDWPALDVAERNELAPGTIDPEDLEQTAAAFRASRVHVLGARSVIQW